MAFDLSSVPIDIGIMKSFLVSSHAGACVTFEGWVRDHNDGRCVTGLEYEAYQTVALSEGEKILEEARERFALVEIRCVHRIGALSIGDLAVWVGVAAAHRGHAFDACRYVIDEVKARVPIWKKEHYQEGSPSWLNATSVAVNHEI